MLAARRHRPIHNPLLVGPRNGIKSCCNRILRKGIMYILLSTRVVEKFDACRDHGGAMAGHRPSDGALMGIRSRDRCIIPTASSHCAGKNVALQRPNVIYVV